jgi:hypothetical protein
MAALEAQPRMFAINIRTVSLGKICRKIFCAHIDGPSFLNRLVTNPRLHKENIKEYICFVHIYKTSGKH